MAQFRFDVLVLRTIGDDNDDGGYEMKCDNNDRHIINTLLNNNIIINRL